MNSWNASDDDLNDILSTAVSASASPVARMPEMPLHHNPFASGSPTDDSNAFTDLEATTASLKISSPTAPVRRFHGDDAIDVRRKRRPRFKSRLANRKKLATA
jgi:hypothetical protein